MGHYMSCDYCREAIDGYPTIRDAFLGTMECSNCGKKNDLDENIREIEIDAFLERVAALEAKLEESE